MITCSQCFATRGAQLRIQGGCFLPWQECQRLSLFLALEGSSGCTGQSCFCSAPSHSRRLYLESQHGLGWKGPLKAIQSSLLPWTGTASTRPGCSSPMQFCDPQASQSQGKIPNSFRILKLRLSFQLMQTREIISKQCKHRLEVS